MGVAGGDEDADDAREGAMPLIAVSSVASEFLDLAFPLRYMPGGTVMDLRSWSWSMVGRFCRSAYVKYAVKCHFRGLEEPAMTNAWGDDEVSL